MIRPVPLRALLSADQEALADVVEQAGRLLAKVVLLRLAVRRTPGGLELTESRLGHLAAPRIRHLQGDFTMARRKIGAFEPYRTHVQAAVSHRTATVEEGAPVAAPPRPPGCSCTLADQE